MLHFFFHITHVKATVATDSDATRMITSNGRFNQPEPEPEPEPESEPHLSLIALRRAQKINKAPAQKINDPEGPLISFAGQPDAARKGIAYSSEQPTSTTYHRRKRNLLHTRQVWSAQLSSQ